MKKKTVKKLVLAKETVLNLAALKVAGGGTSAISDCTSCGWQNTCPNLDGTMSNCW